jgi:hypothetical protein
MWGANGDMSLNSASRASLGAPFLPAAAASFWEVRIAVENTIISEMAVLKENRSMSEVTCGDSNCITGTIGVG